MPNSRTYSHLEYGLDGGNEYPRQYSNTRRVTYPSYAPTQASRSSREYQDRFSLSDHTLVDEHPSIRSRTSSSIAHSRDVVLPISRPAEHFKSIARASPPIDEDPHRRKSPREMIYIEQLTISADGPPLETHLRNTEGNVHIKHLRVEDTPSKRRKSRSRQVEKESESVSKLTRMCEVACVVSLLLQWKEYREYRKEREMK